MRAVWRQLVQFCMSSPDWTSTRLSATIVIHSIEIPHRSLTSMDASRGIEPSEWKYSKQIIEVENDVNRQLNVLDYATYHARHRGYFLQIEVLYLITVSKAQFWLLKNSLFQVLSLSGAKNIASAKWCPQSLHHLRCSHYFSSRYSSLCPHNLNAWKRLVK